MGGLQIYLFGRFRARHGERDVSGFSTRKAQELLCYLLLYRDRPHTRDTLATLLWSNTTTTRSRKYLRQTLWQLQTAIRQLIPTHNPLVLDSEWVQVNREAGVWLDVAAFEEAFAAARGSPGRQLSARQAQAMQDAVALYHGDLLEGWCQDWCLFERERLQNTYLTMLDKLIDYCEAHHRYETGLAHGARILQCDYARERAHRRMMRLHYLSGNRTAALRQYQRCAEALDEELGVGPARSTLALYEQIRADRLFQTNPTPAQADRSARTHSPAIGDLLRHIEELQSILDTTRRKLQEIQAIQITLADQY
jgi:DNA-binding SARP family transcriptional activator